MTDTPREMVEAMTFRDFLNEAFRNIDMPGLSQGDASDIRNALEAFARHRLSHSAPASGELERLQAENARLQVRLADAYKALRSIGEGNLGDGPGQANYATIKTVAICSIPPAARAALAAAQEER